MDKVFTLEFFRRHGRIGGSKKSRRKTEAVRANGKKGGRPRLPDSQLSYAARMQRKHRAKVKAQKERNQ